jgi:hypothetical protein
MMPGKTKKEGILSHQPAGDRRNKPSWRSIFSDFTHRSCQFSAVNLQEQTFHDPQLGPQLFVVVQLERVLSFNLGTQALEDGFGSNSYNIHLVSYCSADSNI